MAADGKAFEGKWEMESTTNLAAYLKALGYSDTVCKIAEETKQTIIFHIAHDGQWTMTESSSFATAIIYFRLGEDFQEETIGGRKVTSNVQLQGNNQLIHKQKCADKVSTITRQVKDDKLTSTYKCEDATAERVFKKVK